MTCSQCQGINTVFDEKHASKKLENYRRNGPDKTTQMLLDALITEGVEGMTLLDIGGGVGVIQLELFKQGLEHATHVEASSAYGKMIHDAALQQGNEERTTFYTGDFIDRAAEIAPADIVTLDRVICCYHDVEQLVGLSAAHARRLYGVVYPRAVWWVRLVLSIENLFYRLRGNPFRAFVHSPEIVERMVEQNGLQRRAYRQTLIWQVVVYAH
jgi:2-polyprenyl-3-methyl-5-hydroxy-6-metoxy-1,4-benzoquinol methylase